MGSIDDKSETRVSSATGAHPAGEELAPGALAGGYEIRGLIGSGGGGMVYRARNATLGRDAAVKVLRRQIATLSQAVARFRREAEVVNLIRHPNIVEIYEFGQLADGRPYFVMELVDGPDLLTRLNQRARLPPEEVQEILVPLCSALASAHAAGVVHRDVKASNISFSQGGVLKLLDFGIAKLTRPDTKDAGLTILGTRLGTPCAMAPEQIRGEPIDHRADIYALGVLVYHLLTGRYPFIAANDQEMDRLHLESAPPLLSRLVPVPPALDALVARCLEKDSARRFQDVVSVRDCFVQALAVHPAASALGERTVEAPLIYVQVSTGVAGADREELLEAACVAVELAEQRLREAGFSLPLCTANAVLGVLVASTGPPMEEAPCAYAHRIAETLAAQVGATVAGVPDVSVRVTLHTHVIVVRGGEVIAGDIPSLDDWSLKQETSGLQVSEHAQLAMERERSATAGHDPG
jgi:hypothetical protein